MVCKIKLDSFISLVDFGGLKSEEIITYFLVWKVWWIPELWGKWCDSHKKLLHLQNAIGWSDYQANVVDEPTQYSEVSCV